MEKSDHSLPAETVDAFAGDELRARIFHDKYALRAADGTVVERTPEHLWRRVACGIAAVEPEASREAWTTQFYWLLSQWRMVPGGRILHAVGNPNKVTSLNCYVLSAPHDSIAGIYRTASELAETMKRGGGVGIDISSLRPAGAPARNAARTSTGAVSFMELFSLTTGIIGQEGRRGALMITLSDSHPDVLAFCRVKRNLDKVRYANISVRVTDAFMRAVEQDTDWLLHYENAEDRIEVKRVIRARELWDELVQGAHACVPYETDLVVWENGQRKLTQMGALVEAFEAHPQRRYEVLSLNLQTLQLERKPVCRAYTFVNTQPVYRAETESGKAFVATADHIVYRLAPGGTCEEVPLARVRPGDFVAIAKTTDKEDHHTGEISVNLLHTLMLQAHVEETATKLVGVPLLVNAPLLSRVLGRTYRQRVAPATILRHVQLAALCSLQRMLAAEVQWERVVTVKQVQAQPAYVYDITVGDNHTFVLANGWAVSNSAEPGCVFWNTVQRFSSSDQYPDMKVISTNPCGEQPLEGGGDCCLGSINLAAFVHNPFTSQAQLDRVALERAVRLTVRFLDDVLTWNVGRHPLPQQEAAAERGRRIGANFMGLADMLCQLGLRYDTDEAIEQAGRIVEQIKLWAYDESVNLAREKGPFPVFDATCHLQNPFFASFPPALLDNIQQYGLRNVTVLTVPPTGTIAALAGVTSGIEPIFDLSYTRRSESLSEREFAVVHPLAAQYHATQGLTAGAPLPPVFVTAHQIDPNKRVLMQATVQRHIDQAISSTVNLPEDTSVETVGRIYRRAWEAGCKGITVYRSGSRENVLTPAREQQAPVDIRVAPRPPLLPGVTMREETPLGTAFVTINYQEMLGEPFEAFFRLGKAGSDVEADAEAMGRLISLIFRLPSPMSRLERLQAVIEQLAMIGGARSIGFGAERVRSVPDGIARALAHYLDVAQNGNGTTGLTTNAVSVPMVVDGPTAPPLLSAPQADFCPRCRQAALLVSEGCLRCTECGFKEC